MKTLVSMTPTLSIEPCGLCDGWVASYGRHVMEHECPITAAAMVLGMGVGTEPKERNQINEVVRKSVFETNSSSSHSITIAAGEFVPDTLPVIDGKVTIYPGKFGWEIEDYYDARTKASYAMVDARGDAAREQMLRDVISKECGGAEVVFSDPDEGYIDHQSRGTADRAFGSYETLRQFIFNPASNLHTDNDNH